MKTKYIFKSVLFCVSFTAIFVLFSFAKNFIPESFERIAHGVVGTIAALVTTVIFLKADKKRFSDIGLVFEKGTIPRLLAGIVIGVVIMGTMVTSVIYFTGASIEFSPAYKRLPSVCGWSHFTPLKLPVAKTVSFPSGDFL